MIKNDTIVSTTDGRLTLLQWLNKVEDALKSASATAVKVVPQADGKAAIEIDFADGTSIKSDPVELSGKLPEGYAVDEAGNITLNGGLLIDKLGNVEMGKNAIVNGTLTLNTPENLIFKTGSINPIPEGYAVDGAGNVTIAGALKANNNGDVQVGKNLEVGGNATFSGKSSFIWHGTINETVEGMTITSNVSGFFFQGPTMTIDGQTMDGPGIIALTAVKNDDGIECDIINPKHYNPATQELRPATVEEILSGNWSFMQSLESGTTLLRDRSDARLTTLNVNKVMGSENDPVIDRFFKVQDEGIVLGEIAQKAKKVDGKSDAKYQHTVHIVTYSDADRQLNVSFTAMSSKNTPINSYQTLHDVFGGRNLTLGGGMKYYTMQTPIYMDLHGGTISTDKIYCASTENVGAYQQPTLETFPNITFTDDVCIPN